MTLSIPDVMVSRDGSVRRYAGHSNRSGELLGKAERHGGSWLAPCAHATCRNAFGGRTQREAIYALREHWAYLRRVCAS